MGSVPFVGSIRFVDPSSTSHRYLRRRRSNVTFPMATSGTNQHPKGASVPSMMQTRGFGQMLRGVRRKRRASCLPPTSVASPFLKGLPAAAANLMIDVQWDHSTLHSFDKDFPSIYNRELQMVVGDRFVIVARIN